MALKSILLENESGNAECVSITSIPSIGLPFISTFLQTLDDLKETLGPIVEEIMDQRKARMVIVLSTF